MFTKSACVFSPLLKQHRVLKLVRSSSRPWSIKAVLLSASSAIGRVMKMGRDTGATGGKMWTRRTIQNTSRPMSLTGWCDAAPRSHRPPGLRSITQPDLTKASTCLYTGVIKSFSRVVKSLRHRLTWASLKNTASRCGTWCMGVTPFLCTFISMCRRQDQTVNWSSRRRVRAQKTGTTGSTTIRQSNVQLIGIQVSPLVRTWSVCSSRAFVASRTNLTSRLMTLHFCQDHARRRCPQWRLSHQCQQQRRQQRQSQRQRQWTKWWHVSIIPSTSQRWSPARSRFMGIRPSLIDIILKRTFAAGERESICLKWSWQSHLFQDHKSHERWQMLWWETILQPQTRMLQRPSDKQTQLQLL